jgi:hypothetical protein
MLTGGMPLGEESERGDAAERGTLARRLGGDVNAIADLATRFESATGRR